MNKNQLRENNPNWKGGKVVDNGYVRIYIGNGKYKAEHTLVMEKKLGRKLLYSEIVHHVDESFVARSNNDPNNLQLTNRSDHIRHHKKGSGKGYWVTFYKDRQKWGLQIRCKDGKYRSAGNYETEEKALEAMKRYKSYHVSKENKEVGK
jgi:hypothetical protein